MDRIKKLTSSARNRALERNSNTPSSTTGSLSAPHATLQPPDNASTTGVNDGYIGPQPGTAVRDYGADESKPQSVVQEPPTSLQSSVDAGQPLPNIQPVPSQAEPPASSNTQKSTIPTGRARGNSGSQTNEQPLRPSAGLRQPSIGVNRNPVSQTPNSGRPRGASAPLAPSRLPTLDENAVHGSPPTTADSDPGQDANEENLSRWKTLRSKLPGFRKDGTIDAPMPPQGQPREYAAGYVDVLDTIDPEVQTLTSLTNVQNSLFIPNLGRFVNRRPTYNIRPTPSETASLAEIDTILAPIREAEQEGEGPRLQRTQTTATLATIDSRMSDSRFAVLPHGTSLEGWSKEDKKELNDHVRHMLHSRRSRFKRAMRGFGQYVRRPLGFLVTLYATLITLFGLAWVLFLIGWINVGGKQLYVVNIIDNVLVALFAIVGDGLAPFRAVDTYHMIFIAHYHHFTWSRRKKDMLPKLHDRNDLPSSNAPITGPADQDDPEKQWEFTVLTPKQQAKLEHHEKKFCKSHSFYKPHETETHYAFPLRLLVAIVVLLDCHSLFQIALGTCTWAIYYKHRPFALTTVILCCSITCNATAGLLIMIGDRRTRKKDVLERMNRQELTEEAIHKIEKKKEKESESEQEDGVDPSKPSQSRHSLSLSRKSKDLG
ncbi:hypothetical protein GQ43DRAFT_444277 [Delitschia confertaspora ATCC 74209]|uniref:Integral membrane protein n=1 Tax=Delitschia confertaspora ATCC 74209 TaxID=1513339 RepID=A0A9P4JG92_9PLEO|nr:hypothetical protein GQ43DRAFT_444277 [Delitschia confertaspora ATCC 74209]